MSYIGYMSLNIWIKSLINAWEMLTDIPLPSFLDNIKDIDNEGNKELLVCFPIVGAIIGIGFYTLAWIVTIFSPSSLIAAIVGGIIITLLSEFITTTSTTAKLATYLTLKSEKKSLSTLLTTIEGDLTTNSQLNQLFFLSIYLLKLCAIALLIYEEKISWFIIVFVISYLIRSQMATWNNLETSQPMINIENDLYATKLPWIIAISISFFISGFAYFPAIIIVAIIAYFLLQYLKKMTEKQLGGVNGSIIGVAGSATELLLLLIGIALLLQ